LIEKFARHIRAAFDAAQAEQILNICLDINRLRQLPVRGLLALLAR
jgi:hypothetical protein